MKLVLNKMSNNFIFLRISFVIFLLFALYSKSYSQESKLRLVPIVIKNVNIITMELPNQIIENATLVIRDNTIQSVNDFVPNDAKVIDGKGKWLIPGLIDMHVHLPNDFSLIKEYPSQSTDI